MLTVRAHEGATFACTVTVFVAKVAPLAWHAKVVVLILLAIEKPFRLQVQSSACALIEREPMDAARASEASVIFLINVSCCVMIFP